MIAEQLNKVFRRSCSTDLQAQIDEDNRDLKNVARYLQIAAQQVGYRIQSGVPSRWVYLHEDRHLPYLLHCRDCDSVPLIQYDLEPQFLVLRIFGPLDSAGISHYLELALGTGEEQNYSVKDITDLSSLIDYEHRGVAVGVHVWEELMRTPEIDLHRMSPLATAELEKKLQTRIVAYCRRYDSIAALFASCRPDVLYLGHDCYFQAVDINLALASNITCLVLPKGKPNHFYDTTDEVGRWERPTGIYRSHLGVWFQRQIESRWQDELNANDLHSSKQLMEQRLGDLGTLHYMTIDQRMECGYEFFKDDLGIPEVSQSELESERCKWVLAFHSFSDEACIWGFDGAGSLYEMFKSAASWIASVAPQDLIVLRPHPNYYRFYRDLRSRMDEGLLPQRDRTGEYDVYLQLHLCRELMKLGVDCTISPPLPSQYVLGGNNVAVVTRHGSIILEAAYTGNESVFSSTAPYAFLFPDKRQQFYDTASLERAMQVTRSKILSKQQSLPEQKDILKYQHILVTPNARGGREYGGIVDPAVSEVEKLADIRYGNETVEEVIGRLRKGFVGELEAEWFDVVFGTRRADLVRSERGESGGEGSNSANPEI